MLNVGASSYPPTFLARTVEGTVTSLRVRRQLLFPVVLPHSGMLPKIQTGNVTEQFGSVSQDRCNGGTAGSAVSVANRVN